MKNILTVIGARPQFIKASVVSHMLSEMGANKEVVVHTGQHYDSNMSDVFFAELGMRQPDYHLGVGGGGHGEMTGRMLIELERVVAKESPDVLLVYGDTNSTLAGALVAAKLHIPVAHVEAGLRSFNREMPEEINRILTDHVSRWLFTPTDTAVNNLLKEGISRSNIFPVGDVMYDVALFHGDRAEKTSDILKRLGVKAGAYVLVTVHRAENTDSPERIRAIVKALLEIAKSHQVVWPLHPRTFKVLERDNYLDDLRRKICVTDPVGYMDMVKLEKNASLIATDSGGVQKEAYFHQIPCVTLRTETEWVELEQAGWNRLVPPSSSERIVGAIKSSIHKVGSQINLYGNGNAAELIVKQLAEAN